MIGDRWTVVKDKVLTCDICGGDQESLCLFCVSNVEEWSPLVGSWGFSGEDSVMNDGDSGAQGDQQNHLEKAVNGQGSRMSENADVAKTTTTETGSMSCWSCKDSKKHEKEEVQFIERLIMATNIATAAGTKADLQLLSHNRQNAVRRYLEKKNRRRYDKQIRYETRKASAAMRHRIKGRFTKTTEASDVRE